MHQTDIVIICWVRTIDLHRKIIEWRCWTNIDDSWTRLDGRKVNSFTLFYASNFLIRQMLTNKQSEVNRAIEMFDGFTDSLILSSKQSYRWPFYEPSNKHFQSRKSNAIETGPKSKDGTSFIRWRQKERNEPSRYSNIFVKFRFQIVGVNKCVWIDVREWRQSRDKKYFSFQSSYLDLVGFDMMASSSIRRDF